MARFANGGAPPPRGGGGAVTRREMMNSTSGFLPPSADSEEPECEEKLGKLLVSQLVAFDIAVIDICIYGMYVYEYIYIVLTLRYQSNHQRINDNMRKCQTRRANMRV